MSVTILLPSKVTFWSTRACNFILWIWGDIFQSVTWLSLPNETSSRWNVLSRQTPRSPLNRKRTPFAAPSTLGCSQARLQQQSLVTGLDTAAWTQMGHSCARDVLAKRYAHTYPDTTEVNLCFFDNTLSPFDATLEKKPWGSRFLLYWQWEWGAGSKTTI